MTNFEKLGFIFDNLNIEAYNEASSDIYIHAFEDVMYSSYAEGIFSAVGSVYRTGRDTTQFSGKVLTRVRDILRKVIAAFKNMVKSAILAIGEQSDRMVRISAKLRALLDEINNNPILNNKEGTYDKDRLSETNLITVQTLNAAGWNLYEVKNTGIDSKSRDGDSLTKSNNIIRNYVKLSITQQDSDYLSSTSKINSFEKLFAWLSKAFVDARILYTDKDINMVEAYKEFQPNNALNKLAKDIVQDINNGNIMAYTKLNSRVYGKYVAQAMSPAGAFVSTNHKESFNTRYNRREDFVKYFTPLKMSEIPMATVLTKIIPDNIQYIRILLEFLVKMDFLEDIKLKAKIMDDFGNRIDKLIQSTPEDIRRAKVKSMRAGTDNGTVKYNDEMYDRYKNTQEGRDDSLSKHENYNPLLNDMIEELTAFSEANDTTYDSSTLSDIATNSQSNLDADNDMSYFNNYEKSVRNGLLDRNDKLNINVSDLTPEGIAKGLQYLHSLIVESSKLTFQEGRFYNLLCKTICNVSEDFIEDVKTIYDDLGFDVQIDPDRIKIIKFNDNADKNKKAEKDTKK